MTTPAAHHSRRNRISVLTKRVPAPTTTAAAAAVRSSLPRPVWQPRPRRSLLPTWTHRELSGAAARRWGCWACVACAGVGRIRAETCAATGAEASPSRLHSSGVVGRGGDGVPPPAFFDRRDASPTPPLLGLKKFVQKLVHCCNWLLAETQCKIISGEHVCRPKLFKNLCLSLVSVVPPPLLS